MRIFINIYRAVMQKYRPLNLLCVYTSVKVSGRRQRENNMGTSLWQLVREASSELLSWLSLCWQGEQQLSWVYRIELLTLKLTEAVGLKPPTQTSCQPWYTVQVPQVSEICLRKAFVDVVTETLKWKISHLSEEWAFFHPTKWPPSGTMIQVAIRKRTDKCMRSA